MSDNPDGSEIVSEDVISDETSEEASLTLEGKFPPCPAFVYEVINKIAVNHRFAIVDLEPKVGTKIGDGYMSEMLAIRMHGRPTTLQTDVFSDIIFKRAPAAYAETASDFQSDWIYEREVLMYAKVLPLMARIQRKLGLNRSAGFFSYPRCVYASFNAVKAADAVIVLADLRSLGYSMLDKTKIASPEHITLFVEQLGRMHGMSFVIQDQHPDDWENIADMLTELFIPIIQTTGFKPIFDATFKRIADLMRPTKYGVLVESIREHYVELYRASFDKTRFGRFGVITHGDCWANNMMFHYDAQGIPDKISMFDFQVSHVRSPVGDLLNYLFSATDAAARAEHMDFYLDTYYANLAGMMRRCESDPDQYFTRDNLDEELRRNAVYGLVNAAMFLPSAVSNDAVDMVAETITEEAEPDQQVFVRLNYATGAEMRRRYVDILDFAEERGWMVEFRRILAKLDDEKASKLKS